MLWQGQRSSFKSWLWSQMALTSNSCLTVNMGRLFSAFCDLCFLTSEIGYQRIKTVQFSN